MHNHFLDKNRRHLNLRTAKIEGVLPEHFAVSYPKFIELLEVYYQYINENDSTELITHLFAARDINETDIQLLSFIEDELLLGDAYFQGFSKPDATEAEREAQLRAAANFSSIMFRSKGTRFAIEWFFRSFYGIDSEVVYPKENIFKVGDIDSKIGAESLKYLTDDKLYQTFALLVRVGIPISQWKEMFKLFAHPAGMYLGGEVLLEGKAESVVSTRMQDSAVEERNTPIYSINVLPNDSADEGTTFDLAVTGTNIPNNTSALYYYIQHISTSDSDFVSPPPSILNPQYFNINDSVGAAVGHFNIPTRVDSDESEGSEFFNVFVIDDEDRTKAQALININDVISSYTLTPDNSNPTEGDTIEFSVQGTGVPDNGNTTLFYYVSHGTTTDSDFVVSPPTSSAAQPFSIINDSGSFTLTTRVDNVVDDSDTFTVSLQTEASGGTQKGSTGIVIANKVPAFNLSVNDVTEGGDVYASLAVDVSTVGETVDWSVTGAASSDVRLITTSGSFPITSTSGSYYLSGTTSDTIYHGPINGTVNFTSSVSGFTDNDGFDLLDQAPVYTITPSPAVSSEGDSAAFVIAGSNIPDSDVEFYVSFGETDASDFVGTVPTSGSPATVTMSGGSSAPSPILQFATNGDLNPETFTASVSSTTGTPLASTEYTILGNLEYDLTLDSANLLITESKTVQTVSFYTTDSDGTYYYWIQGTNIDSDDFVSGYAPVTSKQPFTVTTHYGSIFSDLNEDKIREGSETYNVYVSKTSAGGAIAQSPNITIQDTSVPVYTLDAPDITEGNTLTTTIIADTRDTEFLYFEITGSGVTSRFPITQKVLSVSANTTIDFDTTLTLLSEGDQTGTITARINSHTGTVVSSDTFTLSDDTLSATLVTDLAGDSANEGDTINFTFSGTNIPNGTYRHRTLDIYPVRTDQVCVQGTYFIYLSDTSNLAIGMESNTGDVPGTIVGVSPGSGVTMSSPIPLASLPVGYDFHFAAVGVFDDFTYANQATGSFSVSSNTGTFQVDVAEDSDLSDESYTFGVYDSHIGSLLASRLVTINDTSVGDLVQLSSKPTVVSKTDSTSSVTAEIQFRQDGKYYGSFATVATSSYTYNASTHYWEAVEIDPGDYEVTVVWDGVTVIDAQVFIDFEPNQLVGINDNKYIQGVSQGGGKYSLARRTEGMEQLGTWLNPITSLPSTAGDYRIRATKSSEFGSPTFSGSFGSWELLSSLRSWTVRVDDNNANAGASFVFEIQRVGDAGNSDSWSLTFEAYETYNSGGRSGGGSSTGGDDDGGTDVSLK